jgi:Tfp pilus assembly protein PilP
MVSKEEILEKFKLEEFRLIGSYIKDLEDQVHQKRH